MTFFVLDASVVSAWLLNEEARTQAQPALAHMHSGKALVPQLWHLETRNCLLVAVRRGRIARDRLAERLDILRDIPLRTDSSLDYESAFRLAEKHELSAYDAVYLELAKRHAVPIATLDKALSQAAAREGLSLICNLN